MLLQALGPGNERSWLRLENRAVGLAGWCGAVLALVVWLDAVAPAETVAAWAGWAAYSVALLCLILIGVPAVRRSLAATPGCLYVLAAALGAVANGAAALAGDLTWLGALQTWLYLFGVVALGSVARRWRPLEQGFGWMDVVYLPLLALPVLLRGVPQWQMPMWPSTPVPPLGPAMIVAMLTAPLAMASLMVGGDLPDVGLHWRLGLADVGTAVVAYAVFLMVGVPVGLATGLAGVGHAHWTGADTAGALCSLFFFPAVLEEFYFRGILFNWLAERWGGWPAVGLSSLVFGLAHWRNPHPAAYAGLGFVAGLMYGLVYLRTQKLAAGAITHTLVVFTWIGFFAP